MDGPRFLKRLTNVMMLVWTVNIAALVMSYRTINLYYETLPPAYPVDWQLPLSLVTNALVLWCLFKRLHPYAALYEKLVWASTFIMLGMLAYRAMGGGV
jgi:hypothetical protein